MSAFDPSQKPSWVAGVNTGLGDVLGHDRSSSDHCIITDRNRKHGGVRPNADAVAKFGRAPKVAASRRISFNKEIVDEHRSVRDEAVVPDRDELADKRMGLNPASLADIYSFLNFNERTDERIVIDFATIEIDWLHNGDVLPEFDIDHSDSAKLRLVH